jgi:hypothetical protein
MGVSRPPLEYLASCSKVALESFELSRLNEASNFRKEVQQILQGWIDTEVDARLARWILDSKQAQARDGLQAAMAQPVPLEQLDLSFLPSNGAQASEGEAKENTRKPSGPKLRRAAHPVLPCADGRTSEEPQKPLGMKGAKLLEKRVDAGCSSGSALQFSPRKPPFAQDEENALHELEYFVRRELATSQARPRDFAAEKDSHSLDRRSRLGGHTRRGRCDHFAEVRVFPTTDAMPTADRAYASASPVNSISALEPAISATVADCTEDSRARLNVRTLICHPGPERSRSKAIQPRAVCARRVAPF